MAGKRKRTRSGQGSQGDNKRQRISGLSSSSKNSVIKQAVLVQYYPQVLSLREYLLSKLPSTSKIRRKKTVSVGRKPRPDGKDDTKFANLLDSTLVGVGKYKDASAEERLQQWNSFSQRIGNDDSNFANLSGVGIFSQSEVCYYQKLFTSFALTHFRLLILPSGCYFKSLVAQMEEYSIFYVRDFART